MILVIEERKAPLFRGHPEFICVECYTPNRLKVSANEIGYYFDELKKEIVHVVTTAQMPKKDSKGKLILGYLMTPEEFRISPLRIS